MASNLALVTRTDPLKAAISQHLKQCLTGTAEGGASGEDIGLIEQELRIVAQYNLTIAGNVVERVVAVDFGLTRAEQIQVWAVEDVDEGQAALLP